MAAERPESSTPCEGGMDQSHGALGPQPRKLPQDSTPPGQGGSSGTCKYVLKMCLADRVMSSPMPIFYRGSERDTLVGARPPAWPHRFTPSLPPLT